MKIKFYTLLIACFVLTSGFCQDNLNGYKYIIVPNKYDFLKDADQYQLNSLTKFLFEKHGFEALMEGEDYPADLNANRCSALKSNVLKDSGMFKTKLTVQLKDCNDKVVFTSKVGESREKEYKTAYGLALRDAFESVESLNYSYEPSNGAVLASATVPVVTETSVSTEVQQLKQEIENLKKEQATAAVASGTAETLATGAAIGATTAAVVTPKAEVKKVEKVEASKVKEVISGTLYAQEIENGYQLVDSTPKVVYRLKHTKLDNVFLVENESAIVYKKGDNWIAEYYDANNTLQQQVLKIKF